MNVDNLFINTIRVYCIEMVQKAKSGHPGIALGAAPAAYTLWAKHLKINHNNPNWENRDRFVLSAGHGSSLLYSLLSLFGYGLEKDSLEAFRQLDSLTPGHPEYGHTTGVEITTGPLGQGIANAVGFALAEKYLAAKFNKQGYPIVDHYTYALCGDGCLMEGISHEAASLAGTMGLNKLIILYDSNNITIEGSTEIAFTENVQERFKAYGFNVLTVKDGNDIGEIDLAISEAKKSNKPSLIEIKTKIGYGSPNKVGKAAAHGEPLGEEEVELTKKALGWEYEKFTVPLEVAEEQKKIFEKQNAYFNEHQEMLRKYKAEYPDLYIEWEIWNNRGISVDLLEESDFWKYEGDIATRVSSETVLNKLSKLIPNLIGGSADLAPSTKTVMKDREYFSKDTPSGSNIHFGVREHAMAAIANAMAAHGGLRPYIAGFFVFSDYMKPAMRLAALMKLPVINILTHDSIGVGEDGPTHQPIEQLAALRSIPNFTVMRPCDTKETAAAWYLALTRINSPSALVLSRQNLPLLEETGKDALKGGYVLRKAKKEKPDIILIASGSEVQLIYKAYDVLEKMGISAQVVSMMSFEVFEEQDNQYKETVLPKKIRARLAVEAASSFGWEKYVGLDGGILSIDKFGESGPAEKIFERFGFTVDNVVEMAKNIIANL